MTARYVPVGRDLVFKPDGTTVIANPTNSNIPIGYAFRKTEDIPPRPSDPLQNGETKQEVKTNTTAAASRKNLPSVFPNPMEAYASSNVLWTFACLTPQQFNDPKSYRNTPNDLQNIIFSSAGRFGYDRADTAYGVPEYYINNFTMNNIIGANEKTGNTNAIKFTFDIYEPYSMGILLQSMQVSAVKAGYLSYLDNAPFVLRMDVQGWDDVGREITGFRPKFFVMKLTSTKFTVNEGGSTYKVEAIPYNHQAYSDVMNITYNDVKIYPDKVGNVYEMLAGNHIGSLVSFLNGNEKKLQKEGRIKICDEYQIQFPIFATDYVSSAGNPPKTNKATVDVRDNGANSSSSYWGQATKRTAVNSTNQADTGVEGKNELATASLGFNQIRGGNPVFAREGDKFDEKNQVLIRDGITIDPKKRVFLFGQGQSITAIINQVILSSDYASRAIDPKFLTPQGYVKWFKLDVQLELLGYDSLVGDFAKKVTFRVVPYFVHQSIFAPPTSAPVGYAELMKQIAKQYDYIYTGQNLDVLSFAIDINNLFYTGANPKPEDEAAKTSNQDQKAGEVKNSKAKPVEGPAKEAPAVQTGRARPKRDPRLLRGYKGGADDKTTEQNVAESFQQAFISGASADMISINLEILGDPYWLVDTGLANHFVGTSNPTSQTNDDGTMNYESGNVYVYLTFRTPADVNIVTGLYDFSAGAQESPFGGIYRVLQCENVFSDGTWKQKLKIIRMPGPQGPENVAVQNLNGRPDVEGLKKGIFANLPISKDAAIAVQTGEKTAPKFTVAEVKTFTANRNALNAVELAAVQNKAALNAAQVKAANQKNNSATTKVGTGASGFPVSDGGRKNAPNDRKSPAEQKKARDTGKK